MFRCNAYSYIYIATSRPLYVYMIYVIFYIWYIHIYMIFLIGLSWLTCCIWKLRLRTRDFPLSLIYYSDVFISKYELFKRYDFSFGWSLDLNWKLTYVQHVYWGASLYVSLLKSSEIELSNDAWLVTRTTMREKGDA